MNWAFVVLISTSDSLHANLSLFISTVCYWYAFATSGFLTKRHLVASNFFTAFTLLPGNDFGSLFHG